MRKAFAILAVMALVAIPCLAVEEGGVDIYVPIKGYGGGSLFIAGPTQTMSVFGGVVIGGLNTSLTIEGSIANVRDPLLFGIDFDFKSGIGPWFDYYITLNTTLDVRAIGFESFAADALLFGASVPISSWLEVTVDSELVHTGTWIMIPWIEISVYFGT